MAEETVQTKTDIFMQQKKTIETLQDVLSKQGAGQPQQIVYASPAEQPAEKSPNYLLYAAIAVVAIILLRKVL